MQIGQMLSCEIFPSPQNPKSAHGNRKSNKDSIKFNLICNEEKLVVCDGYVVAENIKPMKKMKSIGGKKSAK